LRAEPYNTKRKNRRGKIEERKREKGRILKKKQNVKAQQAPGGNGRERRKRRRSEKTGKMNFGEDLRPGKKTDK